jgi:predicted choloylglycine hydrolase
MALRYWPARYREELRGIVAGMQTGGYSGFDLTRLAVINSFDDLAGAWGRCMACSAFAVRDGHGSIIVGRNLDYQVIPHSLAVLNTMFICQPMGYTPFVSWGWPGYIGVAIGVSAHRLSISLLTSPTRDTSLRGVPEGLLNRLILEEVQTPCEAFTKLTMLPRTVGTNLLLATPDYACVVESSRSHLALRTMDADHLVVTNHFQAPQMARWQREYGHVAPTLLEDRFLSLEGSRQRAQHLTTSLHGGLTVPEAIHLLTDPVLVSRGQVQSIVIDLARLELWVAVGPGVPACDSGYRHVDWIELFA